MNSDTCDHAVSNLFRMGGGWGCKCGARWVVAPPIVMHFRVSESQALCGTNPQRWTDDPEEVSCGHCCKRISRMRRLGLPLKG